MILKFGARCRGRAEFLGTLHGIAVEPHEKLVLKLVVEQPQAEPLVRVRVPFGKVEMADADQVALAMTPAEFRALPEYGTEASRTPRRPARGARSTPETDERILTARTKIECRDGEVGTLGCLLVDPRTGDVTGVAFSFGLQLTRDVQVGMDQIVEIKPERLVVRFDMDEIEHLPTLRV